jgi:hypothetical protein
MRREGELVGHAARVAFQIEKNGSPQGTQGLTGSNMGLLIGRSWAARLRRRGTAEGGRLHMGLACAEEEDWDADAVLDFVGGGAQK